MVAMGYPDASLIGIQVEMESRICEKVLFCHL